MHIRVVTQTSAIYALGNAISYYWSMSFQDGLQQYSNSRAAPTVFSHVELEEHSLNNMSG